ncbi:MAG: response regulator, partial [Planctomycetia bacterium]|nr:response regulator [Planctomycetia bacterium]
MVHRAGRSSPSNCRLPAPTDSHGGSIVPTLLVVDDEPNILYTITEILAAPDLEVLPVASARDGIEAVRVRRPDAVLLDVRLPDMSGLEAFRRIRAIEPRLPVVIMTAFTTTET